MMVSMTTRMYRREEHTISTEAKLCNIELKMNREENISGGFLQMPSMSSIK